MSLAKLVNAKLEAGELKSVIIILRDNENETLLHAESMEIVAALVDHLTEENMQCNFKLYSACENLLKLVAEKCAPQEVLLELLERLELTKNDEIFTSLLKVLQVALLRLNENKARSLEWSLNSIISYIKTIELPDYMNNIGSEEEQLLECDETIRRILQLYMTVLLFLEPITKEIDKEKKAIFVETGITRKNVIISFILQLMGKPLLYLNAHYPTSPEIESNIHSNTDVPTYSRQVAEDIVSVLSNLLGNPYRLLQYGERRLRWPPKNRRQSEGVFEETSHNIFMNEEKCPLLSLGMFYYLLIAEGLSSHTSPSIYSHVFIFEMSLYFCTELMSHDQTVVNYKGILLAKQLLTIMGAERLSSECLEVEVHRKFCNALSKLIVYSTIERNRKESTLLLRDYILQFDPKGSYLVIVNLFRSVEHSGLCSYVATIYKDLVHRELNNDGIPSKWYVGEPFKFVLLKKICFLKKGIETDLVDNADIIISGLNILRFILIRDKHNQSSIWNCVREVEESFLKPLRTSIDLARAHFKHERSVEESTVDTQKPNFKLTVGVLNGDQLPELTKVKKLQMLTKALNTFDLMDCLLARVIECVNSKPQCTK